jgi:hypothetical protein
MGGLVNEPKSSPPAPSTPKEIKEFLLARFKALPEADVQKMLELQGVVRKYVPSSVSLSEDLIEERRQERP